MNNIRQLTKDEYPKAIELSWQVFTITGKEDFNNEGLEFFKSFIYNKKCINEIIFYGSFDNEALTVYLANLHTSFLCNLIYPTFSRILLYSC